MPDRNAGATVCARVGITVVHINFAVITGIADGAIAMVRVRKVDARTVLAGRRRAFVGVKAAGSARKSVGTRTHEIGCDVHALAPVCAR